MHWRRRSPGRRGDPGARATCPGRPLDPRWPDGGTKRPASVVGKAQASHQKAVRTGVSHHGLGNGIEPELGPTEHGEGPGFIDHPPRHVDEPLPRWTLDLRAFQVRLGRWRRDDALQLPGGAGYITGHDAEKIELSLSALDGDMDVVVSVRIVRSRSTATSRKVGTLDTDQHPGHPFEAPTTQAGPSAGSCSPIAHRANTARARSAMRSTSDASGNSLFENIDTCSFGPWAPWADSCSFVTGCTT